jgi:hypothetical protein
MNLHHQLRTSIRVWLAIAFALFVAAWFLPGGKGADERFGQIWLDFIKHDYSCSAIEMLAGIGFLSLLFAALAALIGWVLQFPVCMALDHFHREKG